MQPPWVSGPDSPKPTPSWRAVTWITSTILGAVIAAMVGIAIYVWQHGDEIDDLNAQIKLLEAQNDAQRAEMCEVILANTRSGQSPLPWKELAQACGVKLPSIIVHRPTPQSKVRAESEAVGTLDTKKFRNRELWFAITTPGVDKFFIQGNSKAKTGPAEINQDGTWVSPSLFVGLPQDTGRHFNIVLIIANDQASRHLRGYLEKNEETRLPIPLPEGAEEYTRVEVIRE